MDRTHGAFANLLRPVNLLTIVLIGVFLWLNRSMPYAAEGMQGEPFGWPIPLSDFDRWNTGYGNLPRYVLNITGCIMLTILSSRRLGELEEGHSAFRLQKVFGLMTAIAFLCSPLALSTEQEDNRTPAAMQLENAAEAVALISIFLSLEFVVIQIVSRISSRSTHSAVPKTSWFIRWVSLSAVLLAVIYMNVEFALQRYVRFDWSVERFVLDLISIGGWPLSWQPESSRFHFNFVVDAFAGGLLLYCHWSSKQTAARLSRNRLASLIAALATIGFAYRWAPTERWYSAYQLHPPGHLVAISIIAVAIYYDVMRSTATATD